MRSTHVGGQSLTRRLAFMIIGVAVVVSGLFALGTYFITSADLTSMTARRAVTIESDATAAVARAYEHGHGWAHASFAHLWMLAVTNDVDATVFDAAGTRLASGGPAIHGPIAPPELLAVQVGHRIVGDVRLTFPGPYVTSLTRFYHHLIAVAAVIGGLSVLLGLFVAVMVARRVARPIRRVIDAVASVNDGNTGTRIGRLHSVAELEALATGVDTLSATLQRQDELRRAMMADVAHELRNPITILQAECEAVVDGVAAPSVDVANSMLEEVHRLSRRMVDLDALAVAESAGLQMTREPVDLADVALDATFGTRQVLQDAGVTVSTSFVPSVVLGDHDRLYQVMTNLLLNAAKHTPAEGDVRVTVRPEGDYAVATVRDTGIGIPPDELSHVFDRFWRGRSAASGGGSGIGLAIVAELVRAHRGEASVASTVGVGTEFTVRIPLMAARTRAWALGRGVSYGELVDGSDPDVHPATGTVPVTGRQTR